VGKRRQVEGDVIPLREELEVLAREYHHLHNEHERTNPDGSTRRRIEDKLLAVRERFDRLVDELVDDEDLRRQWREYLRYKSDLPDGPEPIESLLFKGTAAGTGSVAVIRGRSNEELKVIVDGSLVERIPARNAFDWGGMPARYRMNSTEFVETFDVSGEALDALTGFLDEGGSPPWEHSRELLSDGIIDTHWALTPRGQRALRR
jgi:hypothetical protein